MNESEPTAAGPFRLVPVGNHNRAAVLSLQVKEEQIQMVATTTKSLHEAKTNSSLVPRVFVEGHRVVGFAMYQRRNDGTAYIWRVMVGAEDQGRGLGRKLMEMLIAEIRAAGHPSILISHRPQNRVAAHLFESLGFEHEDVEPDGEVLRRLRLQGPG